jgi:hypothetical protein
LKLSKVLPQNWCLLNASQRQYERTSWRHRYVFSPELAIANAVESAFLLKLDNVLDCLVFQLLELGLARFSGRDIVPFLKKRIWTKQTSQLFCSEWRVTD